MYVNPFWFGVLMTIVTILVVMIIIAIVRVNQGGNDADHEQKRDP